MATKSKPAAKSGSARSRNTRGNAAQNTTAKSTAPQNTGAQETISERPRVFARSTVVPAVGIGVITAFLAYQEHAPLAVGIIVAVVVAFVVIGMIALKRALYGG